MKRLVSVGSFGAKIAIVITATVGGTALVGSSVFASLTATAFNTTTQSVTSGTLILTQAPGGNLSAGFATSVTGLAPADTINRFIDLTNGGTIAGSTLVPMTLGLSDANSTLLTSSPSLGLQVVVYECPTAYPVSGTCLAGETQALISSANALFTAKTLTLAAGDYVVGGVTHLKFAITLPASSEVTPNGAPPASGIQGQVAKLTWTFTETQRALTNTVA